MKKAWNPLVWGIAAMILAHLADICTTIWGVNILGMHEQNPYIINPITGKVMLGLIFQLKAVGLLVAPGFLGLMIWAGTKSKLLSSLPFWYEAWNCTYVALIGNSIGIWSHYAR